MFELEHHDVWRKTDRKRGFGIEIRRAPFTGNENVWCLYAMIAKRHPLFSRFTDDTLDSAGEDIFDWHGGVTYAEWEFRKKEIAGVKIGCDYLHDMDDQYRNSTRLEDNCLINDARRLYEALESYCTEKKP